MDQTFLLGREISKKLGKSEKFDFKLNYWIEYHGLFKQTEIYINDSGRKKTEEWIKINRKKYFKYMKIKIYKWS